MSQFRLIQVELVCLQRKLCEQRVYIGELELEVCLAEDGLEGRGGWSQEQSLSLLSDYSGLNNCQHSQTASLHSPVMAPYLFILLLSIISVSAILDKERVGISSAAHMRRRGRTL